MSEYKKQLGQHFIYDENVLEKIVNAATEIKGKNILEVGAGVGTLTKAILSKEPTSLISVEKDQRFAETLFSLEKQYKNYKCVIGDALSVRVSELFEKKKMTIIANLPYNIGTRLLLNWLTEPAYIEEMVLMFQKEVVERICAQPRSKNYGALSVLVQIKCKFEAQFTLPPEVFTPAPKVTSAVLKLILLKKDRWPNEKFVLEKILKEGFSQRRKTMNKSLSKIFKSKELLHSTLEEIGATPSMRIEELAPEQLCRLSCLVKEKQDNHKQSTATGS